MDFPSNIIIAVMALNPTFFILALVAILLDLITGFVIKGLLPRRVSSSVMREGLIHKAWEIAIIICAALLDIAISVGMGVGLQPMSVITCTFIFLMEIASVCENALEGNPDLANAPVIKYVSQAKDDMAAKLDPDATTPLPRHRLEG